MRVSTLPLMALCLLALILSVVAFFRSGGSGSAEQIGGGVTRGADAEIVALRAEIEALRARLGGASAAAPAPARSVEVEGLLERFTRLEARVDALASGVGAAPRDTALVAREQDEQVLAALSGLDDEQFDRVFDSERMERLTERAMTRLQTRKARASMARWVNPGSAGVDGVLRRANDELSLDPRRREQLRRIVVDANEAQQALLAELSTDPPPAGARRDEIMVEIKHTWTARNDQLVQVLSEEELRIFTTIEAEEAKASTDPDAEG